MPTSLTLFSSQHPPASKLFSTPKDVKEDTFVASSVQRPPHIEIRKSCEFSHHSPACIKKATTNLNKLQKRLEELGNYVKAADEVKHQNVATERTKVRDCEAKLESIKSGKALEIYPDNCGVTTVSTEIVKEDEYSSLIADIPKKCMQKLQGVRHLLERVESDRVSMVKLLAKECERTAKLREMVDAAAYKRIHELPAKVQEEHDKCIYDIHELKWHFEYQCRLETKLFEEAKQMENLNNKLSSDINLVTENKPLLEEKLQLEDKAIEVIQQKQDQTDATLQTAEEEMNRIKKEFEGLKLKAGEEQRIMAQKVSKLSSDLNANLDSLIKAQNDHMKMKEDMVDTQNKILDQDAKTKSEEKHFENLKEIGAFLKEKVNGCKAQIVEQSNLCMSFVQEIEKIRVDKAEQDIRLTEMRKRLEHQLASNTKELRKMIMLNKKTKKEIQTFKKRIENCEKNRISNEKAAKRAVTELETIQDDLLLIKEQALDLKHLHVTLQMKLDQENLKSAEGEEKLAEQAASLLKENKDESHARKILLARIKAESASFEHKKNESEIKKQKILQTDVDLKNLIENINQQIEKLQLKYEERSKTIEGLDRLLVQVADKSTVFHETTSKELAFLQNTENSLKLKIADIVSKQEHMDTTTENLNKKSHDMSASAIMMNKFLSSNENAIEELQEEITELQVQLDTANCLDEKLRKSLAEVEGRSSGQKEKHCELRSNRGRTLDHVSKLLAKSLKENDMLATKYINLQYKHINEKNQFINTYEKNMIAEESLRDKESLCELHTRLHEALKCYYQLRGIQTKAGLARFEDMTQTSYTRLRYIQTELEKCIFNVHVFLKASKRSRKVQVPTIAFSTQQPMSVLVPSAH